MVKQEQNAYLHEDEIEIDLKEIFYLLLGNWRSIFLAMLVGALVLGAFQSFLIKPPIGREPNFTSRIPIPW